MIKIKGLSKSYGANKVLNAINLEFEKGSIYGVVGKNGAGKTTLFRCLSGLEDYDGEIRSDFDILKNNIGFLATNPLFMSRITGWEYLKLLCVARGIKTDDFNTQNIFDLPLNQYAETYSTGMKKKLALLGILLQKNEVYILDEPFNGVDIQSNILISAIIKKLNEAGKTIIISSHIFSTLRDACDHIFLIESGEISKSYAPNDFTELESKMKKSIIEDRIDELDII